MSGDGEISQSSSKVIDKIYAGYEAQRLEKANQFLRDLAISRFADILGGLDAIESSESLNEELQKYRLLKSDIEIVVRRLTLYVPALGILSGGIRTSKHVNSHMSKTGNERTRQLPRSRPTRAAHLFNSILPIG